MKNIQLQVLTEEDLKKMIIKAGATLVGFGNVSDGLAKEIKHLPCAISIAVRHLPVEIAKAPRVVAYSNQLEAVDRKLEIIQKMVVGYLKKHGYRFLAIPPDSMRVDHRFIARLYPIFPHKTAATCSGLGWIGKSGLLVNKQYGPRLSWATILTNAPFKVTGKPYYKGICGSCKKCVEICPAGAIEDREWVRGVSKISVKYDLCSEHMEKNKQVFGKAICGLCILACSKGRGSVEEAWLWRL